MENKKEKSTVYVSTILLFGSFCAAGLLVLGLGILLFQARPQDYLPTTGPPSFSGLISSLFSGEPMGIIHLGILVMMLTPFLRVVAAAFSFFSDKDYRYATVALGVMLILLFTILPTIF
jgi:uncharacterized membrane protein